MAVSYRVPTLNDDPQDFYRLFRSYRKLLQLQPSNLILDLSNCQFLRQNAVAFLGGLTRVMQAKGTKVHFKWKSCPGDVLMNLGQNGFRAAMDGSSSGWSGNSIPYREDRVNRPEEIASYLETQWLGRGWVHVTEDIQNEVACTVQETYSNAFEHGNSRIGVFSCGQRYPQLNELKLTVVDFGVGIPYNVRKFRGIPNLGADLALKWAFEPGMSTRPNNACGGAGLDTLKDFVRSKQGKLEVYSDYGHVEITSQEERYTQMPVYFQGTLINITVKCDISCYT